MRPAAQTQASAAGSRRSAVEAGRLVAGALHILDVPAAVLMHALGRHFEHAVRQGCEKRLSCDTKSIEPSYCDSAV